MERHSVTPEGESHDIDFAANMTLKDYMHKTGTPESYMSNLTRLMRRDQSTSAFDNRIRTLQIAAFIDTDSDFDDLPDILRHVEAFKQGFYLSAHLIKSSVPEYSTKLSEQLYEIFRYVKLEGGEIKVIEQYGNIAKNIEQLGCEWYVDQSTMGMLAFNSEYDLINPVNELAELICGDIYPNEKEGHAFRSGFGLGRLLYKNIDASVQYDPNVSPIYDETDNGQPTV